MGCGSGSALSPGASASCSEVAVCRASRCILPCSMCRGTARIQLPRFEHNNAAWLHSVCYYVHSRQCLGVAWGRFGHSRHLFKEHRCHRLADFKNGLAKIVVAHCVVLVVAALLDCSSCCVAGVDWLSAVISDLDTRAGFENRYNPSTPCHGCRTSLGSHTGIV